MNNFKFIFVSKDDKFSFSQKEENNLYENNPKYVGNVEFIRVSNNKNSITKVYNSFISTYRNDKTTDFLIFLHADVSLDFASLIEHISKCSLKYDIMGLCGCQKIVTSQSPLNWFTGSIPYPKYRWGCVTHGEDGQATSYYSEDRKDITDSQVACIDGLCIIFSKKALETGIMFDETFMFDQYDTDISFSAIMKYNLRLGVIVETSLNHYSVGKSILTREFLTHEIDLRKKWNLEIPKNSPINRILKKTDENVVLT